MKQLLIETNGASAECTISNEFSKIPYELESIESFDVTMRKFDAIGASVYIVNSSLVAEFDSAESCACAETIIAELIVEATWFGEGEESAMVYVKKSGSTEYEIVIPYASLCVPMVAAAMRTAQRLNAERTIVRLAAKEMAMNYFGIPSSRERYGWGETYQFSDM